MEKHLKIINKLDISTNGLIAYNDDDGEEEKVFLKQGDMDGACGPYSALMSLIICGAVKRKAIVSLNNTGKLKGFFNEFNDFTPLIRNGITSTKLSSIVKKTFGDEVSFKTKLKANEDLLDILIKTLLNENPLLLMVDWKDESYHFVVAVGMEYELLEDETYEIKKIFVLDPSGTEPKYAYWNQTIIVNKNDKKNPYKWLTSENNTKGYLSIKLNNGIVVEDKI